MDSINLESDIATKDNVNKGVVAISEERNRLSELYMYKIETLAEAKKNALTERNINNGVKIGKGIVSVGGTIASFVCKIAAHPGVAYAIKGGKKLLLAASGSIRDFLNSILQSHKNETIVAALANNDGIKDISVIDANVLAQEGIVLTNQKVEEGENYDDPTIGCNR